MYDLMPDYSMHPLTADTVEHVDVYVSIIGDHLDVAWRCSPEPGYCTTVHEETYMTFSSEGHE